MGGQTALNLAVELADSGVLERYGVELIGAKLEAIKKAEDRLLFKDAMNRIGLEMPKSQLVGTVSDGLTYAAKIGFPVVIRPSFTLGGSAAGSHTTARRSPTFWRAGWTSRRCTSASSRRACWAGRSTSWR